ncbi:MAG: hypothetical protein K9L64_05735, partial [Candidatus Izimaplasma sp.]|nr:hypothetical protein [Candidatus Izimaplasma bacterium]
MDKQIKNADIVLLSGNMTNIFFDMEYYNYNNIKFDHNTLCQHLNQNMNKTLKHSGKWIIPNDDNESSLKTRLSASTFETQRKKHNTIHFNINSFNLDDIFNNDNKNINKYKSKYKEIKGYLSRSLIFKNTLLKFGCHGDVIFHTTVPLNDVSINSKQYNTISAFIRNVARHLYKDIIKEACVEYIKIIEETLNQDIFNRIFFEIEDIFEVKDKLDYSISRSMYAICWVHIIYDDDYNEIDNKALANDIAFREEKTDYLYSPAHNSHVYIGWSHTIFFLVNNQNIHEVDEINYHITPIENEFAEWEFIIAMTKNIEKLLFHSYNVFESNKFFFIKTTQFKKNINQLFFFIKRIMHSYDNTAITTNRYQAKLMEAQEKKWEIDKYHQSFEEKSKSLYQIVDYIIQRKKTVQGKILNGILFTIALLSTIEISNIIYRIIIEGESTQLLFSLG